MKYFKLSFLILPIFPLFNLVYFKDGLTSIGYYNYLDEYIFLAIWMIIGVLFYFLKDKIVTLFLIYLFCILLSFFGFEFYLLTKFQKQNEYGDINQTSLYKEYLKKKDIGVSGATVPPIYFLDNSKSKSYLPLSNLSNRLLIACNENNYYSIFKTDRYGFNNPDEEWDKNKINFVFLGDSFTQGNCVNEEDSIPGNFREKGFKGGILNLGVGGNGPLLVYFQRIFA